VEIANIKYHQKFDRYPGVCRNDGEGLRDLRSAPLNGSNHVIADEILLTDPIN
jgi:hypothetical protein